MINILHLGDVTKIDGAKVPIVDVITFGAPCQDLSVAGKRAGMRSELNGDTETTRSGLFFDALRIIKEMRAESERQLRSSGADYDRRMVRPRFSVYENVCGAFSSNGGEDFRIVLEETARIADETAVIPRPPKGKWSLAGCIVGDGWSLAWRTTDNQFWGTPQRRRRIALVADFGGERAAEILFERDSVCGNPAESGQEREGTPEVTERHPDAASYTLKVRGGAEFDRYGKRAGKGALVQTELSGTLGVSQDQTLITMQDLAVTYRGDSITSPVNVSNPQPGDPCHTLTDDSRNYLVCGEREGTEREVVCIGNGQTHANQMNDKVGTLNCMHDQQAVMVYGFDVYNQEDTGDKSKTLNAIRSDADHVPVVYGLDRASFNQGENAKYDFAVEEELAPTVLAKGPGGVLAQQ